MNLILSFILALSVSVGFGQSSRANVRCMLFRGGMSGFGSVSVTVYSDPSIPFIRPNMRITLASSPPIFVTLQGSVSVGGLDKSLYLNNKLAFGISDHLILRDSFWVAGVKNFVGDKSRVPITADLDLMPWIAPDTSPDITNMPLSAANFTTVGNQVTYNPYAVDADGDSISYHQHVLSYAWTPSTTVDPVTGLWSFSKDSLDNGRYAFAYEIWEHKKGAGAHGYTNLFFIWTNNSTVGIAEQEKENIKLFPNPNNGTFSVDCSEDFDLTVFNMLGQEVLRSKAQETFEIKEKGIYIVTLKTQSRYLTQKVVVE